MCLMVTHQHEVHKWLTVATSCGYRASARDRTLSAYPSGDLRKGHGFPGRPQSGELARPECRWVMLAYETWAGLLLRRAGTPVVRSKGEDQVEYFP